MKKECFISTAAVIVSLFFCFGPFNAVAMPHLHDVEIDERGRTPSPVSPYSPDVLSPLRVRIAKGEAMAMFTYGRMLIWAPIAQCDFFYEGLYYMLKSGLVSVVYLHTSTDHDFKIAYEQEIQGYPIAVVTQYFGNDFVIYPIGKDQEIIFCPSEQRLKEVFDILERDYVKPLKVCDETDSDEK